MAANLEELLNPQAKRPAAGKHELLKTLISLASLLLAGIGLATQNLPWWALTLLSAVLLILLGFIAWSPAMSVYAQWRDWRARNRAAWIFYPELEQMLQRLLRELSDSYTNNLIYELRNFVTVRDKKGNIVVENLTDFNRISEWLRLFAPKAATRRPSDFADVARAMHVAASQYWWMCYGIQNRLQLIAAQQLLEEPDLRKLRQSWNNGREGSNRFFIEWADLIERINNEFGDHLGSGDRSALKSIE